MKKSLFLLALPLVFLLTWCWTEEKIDITDNDIDLEPSDKYFELVECIIENDNNEKWSQEMKDELRAEIKNRQEEWKLLDEDELAAKCVESFSKFEALEDQLLDFGCSTKNLD